MTSRKPQPVELVVDRAFAGVRLDRWLRKLLPRVPLAHIHKMLRKGEVRRVEETGSYPAGPADRIQPGERFSLRIDPDDLAPPADGAKEESVTLPILYDDGHVLAFDKPAGMAAHPGSGHKLGRTVVGALLARASGHFRPGLVGRLDRDTSGVQLVGISPEGLRGLEELSRLRKIRKTYVALAVDKGLPDRGKIDTPLVDRRGGRSRMQAAGAKCDGAIQAQTLYRVIRRLPDFALLEVEPITGRRHQIRAHMASLGAPLAGDVRYGDARTNELMVRLCGLRRLFLHCARAEFVHPVTGQRVLIESTLPEELSRALQALEFTRRTS